MGWGGRPAATKPKIRWEKGHLTAREEKEHLVSTSGHSSLCVQLPGNYLSSSFPFPPRKQRRVLGRGPHTTLLDYSKQDYTSVFPVLYLARASELSPFRPLCNKTISKLARGRKELILAEQLWVFLLFLLTFYQICSGIRLHIDFRQKSPK